MKKIVVSLSIMFVAISLVACGGGTSNDVLEEFLDVHREEMIEFLGEPGVDLEVEVGNENELLFTFEMSDEMYEAVSEAAEDMDEDLADIFQRGFENHCCMVDIANDIRDETELDDIRITTIMRGGGSEITRKTFYSE